MNKNFKYEVITKSEEKEQDWVIQKSGLTAEFTLNDIKRDIEILKKMKIEMDAKVGIEAAILENISVNYPDAPKMEEKLRVAVFLYQKSFATKKMCEEKVAEIDKQLKEYAEETQEILNQTNLSLEEKTIKIDVPVPVEVAPEENAK